jgi:hypothetical protein
VALFDFDNDGNLDVYLVQGHPVDAPTANPELRGRLYRNDLDVRPDGSRTLHFTDVATQSGIDARAFGFGVAAGDVDNDGFVGRKHMALHRGPATVPSGPTERWSMDFVHDALPTGGRFACSPS